MKSGIDDPRTLTCRSNLANAYHTSGRLTEAAELYGATLKAELTKLGEDHTTTLATRNNLADLYRDLGRHKEAIDSWRRRSKPK